MKEKIVIITGASSGIGKAAALKFATEGYTVTMACRNLEKGRKVQKEIIKESNNDRVDLKELDSSSFASIRAFCSAYKSEYEKVDILIHNAAYFKHGEKFRLSPDNIELTFATNVFGPFLMTKLLLEQLKKSEDPRVLNAGSNIIKHFFDPKKKVNFDNIQGEWNASESFSVYKMYCSSKMAFLMLTFKMAKEFKDYGIKVNYLQINGAKMSKDTLKNFKLFPWRAVAYVQNLFLPEPEFMANHYFDICISDKFKNVSGKHINYKQEIMQPASSDPDIKTQLGTSFYPVYADNIEVTEKLWQLSEELTVANY